jgi:hypothetical protein
LAGAKTLTPVENLLRATAEKELSMVRREHAIAACNDRALSAGMDIAVPVSSKTKAKTTTKTV